MDTKKVKIAISSNGPSKEDLVAQRFARAPYFIVYDQSDLSFSTIENNAIKANSGAAIETAKILLDSQIDIVLAPKLGDKAFVALEAMEIDSYECNSEQTVHDALYSFFEHQLPKIEHASIKGHHKQ